MLDCWLTAAVVSAAAQFGVERVEQLSVELSEPAMAEQRSDVLAYVAFIAVPCGQLDVKAFDHVLVDELVQRGVGARMTSIHHLLYQLVPLQFGLLLRMRACLYHLLEIKITPGHRISAGVDPGSQ
jgi:hypothetical protein